MGFTVFLRVFTGVVLLKVVLGANYHLLGDKKYSGPVAGPVLQQDHASTDTFIALDPQYRAQNRCTTMRKLQKYMQR